MNLQGAMQSTQQVTNASLPPLRFLHISDPREAKLPSHRKAVHTHAALFQASQDRAGREPHAKRKEPRKRRRADNWPGESVLLELAGVSNSHYKRQEIIFPAAFWAQKAYQCFGPTNDLLGAGRVDPFRSYPVPWEPTIPLLVDHCMYLSARSLRHIN